MNENLILAAVRSRFEAERLEGLATLNIYITNPAGIGEHPQVVDEACNALKKIGDAESALETLTRILNSESDNTEQDKTE